MLAWAALIYGQNVQNELDNEHEKTSHMRQLMHDYDGSVYSPLDFTENKALWVATVFLLASSFLFGFKGANDNQIVCLKCGNIQPIGENKEANS